MFWAMKEEKEDEEEEENSKAMNPKKGELHVNFGALVSKCDNW